MSGAKKMTFSFSHLFTVITEGNSAPCDMKKNCYLA